MKCTFCGNAFESIQHFYRMFSTSLLILRDIREGDTDAGERYARYICTLFAGETCSSYGEKKMTEKKKLLQSSVVSDIPIFTAHLPQVEVAVRKGQNRGRGLSRACRCATQQCLQQRAESNK